MSKTQAVSYPLVLCCCFLFLLAFIWFRENANASIVTTPHNLSVSGPGPVKAVSETQICIFCHTPHKAYGDTAGPLWNHSFSSVASYTLPTSSTQLSTPQNPPDGDSRLCLSCHDGTVAVGSVVNLGGAAATISMQSTSELTASGQLAPGTLDNFGTNLSGHHLVSIEVDNALITDKQTQCNNGLVTQRVCYPSAPAMLLSTANLYGAGPHTNKGVQCSSCHDAHDDSNTYFLRASQGTLCGLCHVSCSSTCP